MNALWPILLMVVWAALILATNIQGSRLLRLFRERYPQIAQREIPFMFDNWRHPEKAIFFFRRRARDILRPDPEVWRERQRFVALSLATLTFWIAGVITICILGILLT
jgi:hypothetical protein